MRINCHRLARARTIALSSLVLIALASPLRAQVFYSYPGAATVSDYSPSLGLFLGFGDDILRAGGFARFNVNEVSDLGIEAVFDDVEAGEGNDGTGFFGAGVDYRYQIVAYSEESPVDISAQGGAGFQARDDFFALRIPLGGMVSRDILLKNNRTLVPYGGVYMLIDYVSVGDESDTEVDVELRLGTAVEIVERASVFAALHVGDETLFMMGFNAGL